MMLIIIKTSRKNNLNKNFGRLQDAAGLISTFSSEFYVMGYFPLNIFLSNKSVFTLCYLKQDRYAKVISYSRSSIFFLINNYSFF